MLFESGITYIEGGRTSSGFYTVEDTVKEKYQMLHALLIFKIVLKLIIFYSQKF